MRRGVFEQLLGMLSLGGALALSGCGKSASSSSDSVIDVAYTLARQYTGQPTNTLTIEAGDGSDDRFSLYVESEKAATSISEGTMHPLTSQVLTFSYTEEGIYSANFEIKKNNGQPYLFEILTWEYSTEVPDPPIISFDKQATNQVNNNLRVSDSRSPNVTEIWIGGDVSLTGQTSVEEEGYWQAIDNDTTTVPVVLTPENGLKTVQARFRNIYGNVSELATPAEIVLQTSAAEDCDAVPLASTISNNKLTLKLSATSELQTYYSVMGDIKTVVDENPFHDEDIVFIYLEPTPGQKTITVYLEDVAGNICLEKEITVLIDPDFESEGIWVEDATYWTDSEDIVVDVFFDHFPDQEPLQLKITGDVAGDNTHAWIDYAQDLSIKLNPSTSGSRQILAQYRDAFGEESYYISKRIFLKPSVTLEDAVLPAKNVIISNILGAESITIVGCNEVYTEVAYQASFPCLPNAASIDVTWNFPDDETLTKSAIP